MGASREASQPGARRAISIPAVIHISGRASIKPVPRPQVRFRIACPNSKSGFMRVFSSMNQTRKLRASFAVYLGSRKRQVAVLALFEVLGIGLLSVASGGMVWAAVALAGFVRDAFMGLFLTMVIETRGVGPALAGSAIGLVMALGGMGSSIAPALGNSLDAYWSGAPFLFWAGLAAFGLVHHQPSRPAPASKNSTGRAQAQEPEREDGLRSIRRSSNDGLGELMSRAEPKESLNWPSGQMRSELGRRGRVVRAAHARVCKSWAEIWYLVSL